jgi:hypothetical protein
MIKGGGIDVRGEFLFHTDGRAAASDIARQGEQVLDVHHFDLFVACQCGGLFEIDLAVNGQAKNQGTRSVSRGDQRFEGTLKREADLLGDMHARKVIFVDLVGFGFIRNAGGVELAHGVGFDGFGHKVFSYGLKQLLLRTRTQPNSVFPSCALRCTGFDAISLSLNKEMAKENQPRGLPLEPHSAQIDVTLFRPCRNGRSTHICANRYKFRFCVGVLMVKRQHGSSTQNTIAKVFIDFYAPCVKRNFKRDGKQKLFCFLHLPRVSAVFKERPTEV